MAKSYRFSSLHVAGGMVALVALIGFASTASSQGSPGGGPSGQPMMPHDPGVRGGPAGAGGPLAGLHSSELALFYAALGRFQEIDSVSGTINDAPRGTQSGAGLGPRFNMNSCAGCHAQPTVGGTSPFINPEMAVATLDGAQNTVPSFITLHGPVPKPVSSTTLTAHPMAASMISLSSPAAATPEVAILPSQITSRRSSRTMSSSAFLPRSLAPGRSKIRPTPISKTMLRPFPVSAKPMASPATSIIAPMTAP